MNEVSPPRDVLETHDWFDYADFYDRMAARSDFRVYVELGCWKGHSIRRLAKRLQERGGRASVFGVDLWDVSYLKEYAPEEFSEGDDYLFKMYDTNMIEAGVRGLVRDIREGSWDAARHFEDASVDFVFVDADHAYESVIRDIRAWLPKIRPGGIIAGHDYFTYPSVRRAVEEIFDDKFEVDGSVWVVNVPAPGTTGVDETQRRLRWLKQQREAWIRTTDQLQATIQQVENSLKWTEDQRLAWQKTAEKSEERLSSWLQVAEERERTLIEFERVNGLLESTRQRLSGEVQALEREKTAALSRLAALEGPFHQRMMQRCKALFPGETFRGRVVRKLARMAR